MDEALLPRLRELSQEHYARTALKIVPKQGGGLVPLEMRPAQAKLQKLLDEQRAAGMPMRAWVLKSRKTGISTWVQGVLIKRTTTMPNRTAVTIAQDSKTAGALFRIGYRMWANLPPAIRPALANRLLGAKNQMLHFGDRTDALLGGLDSRLQVDTAKEIAAGRGETFTDMHLSECAWWDDGGKALSVITAVPDEPETLVVGETTANGFNWFHERWKDAIAGAGSFEPVFIGWTEDPDCWRAFRTAEQREEFVASIGTGPWGAEEEELQEVYKATPEQLYFRRTTIVDKAGGKLELFDQEFPVSWPRAFIGSGRQVFSIVFTARAMKEAEAWSERSPEDGGPQRGIFRGVEPRERRLLDGTIEVPTRALWVPESEAEGVSWWPGYQWSSREPAWTRWQPAVRTAEEWRQAYADDQVEIEAMESGVERALALQQEGPRQYVIACDPADDVENQAPQEIEDHAFSAAVVIDHRTGEQVAEFEGRIDHDIVARHLYLAGLFFGEGWLSVEATGGYGNAMLKTLWQRFSYKRLFERQRADGRKEEKMRERLGWDTNRRTKPEMEYGAAELLREGTHGIRSPRLAMQLTTYVKDDRDRHGPSPGSFSDVLLAWMQAQEVRRLKPLLPAPRTGPRPNSMVRPRSPRLR